MDHEKFQIAKHIEKRIAFLQFTKKYLESCFEGSMFGVRIEAYALSHTLATPINKNSASGSINSDWTINSLTQSEPEDTEYIINSIDERIKELETQFEKL